MAVDIDFEGPGYIGVFVIADDKGDLISIRFGQPELLVKALVIEYTLVQCSTILVFHDETKFIGARIVVGNIE